MAQFEHPYLSKVAALRLPEPERAMITHGSALVVRGVREPNEGGDIDLVVSQPNIEHMRRNLGWAATRQLKYYAEDEPLRIRYTRSPDGEFDAFAHDFIPEEYLKTGRGRVYLPELLERHDYRFDQDAFTGIWVASLDHVAATKRGTGRPKDEADLRRIDEYRRPA